MAPISPHELPSYHAPRESLPNPMASAATFPKLRFRPRSHIYSQTSDPVHGQIKFCNGCICQIPTASLLVSGGRRSLRTTFLPVSAGNARPATASDGATPSLRSFTDIQKLLLLLKPPRNAGRGSSIAADESKKDLSLENVQTSVVSRDDENINVRVQVPGKATQKVFDQALVILARDAPPVPGFRKSKGGKTSNIPSSILLQMLGKSRVTKFVLQEILSITIGEFVKKENLKVNPEIQTTQSEAEMESAFTPGSAFGFNVVLQLEKSDGTTEEGSEEQPDTSE